MDGHLESEYNGALNGRLGLSRGQSLFLWQIVTAGSVKTVTASIVPEMPMWCMPPSSSLFYAWIWTSQKQKSDCWQEQSYWLGWMLKYNNWSLKPSENCHYFSGEVKSKHHITAYIGVLTQPNPASTLNLSGYCMGLIINNLLWIAWRQIYIVKRSHSQVQLKTKLPTPDWTETSTAVPGVCKANKLFISFVLWALFFLVWSSLLYDFIKLVWSTLL